MTHYIYLSIIVFILLCNAAYIWLLRRDFDDELSGAIRTAESRGYAEGYEHCWMKAKARVLVAENLREQARAEILKRRALSYDIDACEVGGVTQALAMPPNVGCETGSFSRRMTA